MPKKLLFISSANLSSNPRLFKELKLALSMGCEVDFIGFKLGNWSDAVDADIIPQLNAKFHYIPLTRKPFMNWFRATLSEKMMRKIYPFFKQSLKVNALAHSKRSFLLMKQLNKRSKKYDLIIAHTLPTLYPAYKFAAKTQSLFTFDIEDYHPGESAALDAANEVERQKYLMKTLLPKAAVVSYASPLIGKYSLALCDEKINKHKTVNNCFSQTEFQYRENKSEKIKFVWFSQNIAAGRGLELALPALHAFNDRVELHLIGNLYPKFYDTFLSNYSDIITIHKPLPQKDLNLKLSEFDVGLALELKTADFNREICLTNKIWAYLQSGLYILATDTSAQAEFMQEHENCGIITKQNTQNFAETIHAIINNAEKIRTKKIDRFQYANEFSWEHENKKLTEIWNRLL